MSDEKVIDAEHFAKNAKGNTIVKTEEEYKKLYKKSIDENDRFWDTISTDYIDWFQPYTHVKQGSFIDGDIAWYLNGKLNVCYNCVDRHVEKRGDQVAILFEGDEPGDIRKITYSELQKEVCRYANLLKECGIKKGDSVCIYMPNSPEGAFAMLACARIGAPHSVVFAGFSASALRDRILDGKCKLVFTANESKRGGKVIPLKKTVDEALKECKDVVNVLVDVRTKIKLNMVEGRDIIIQDAIKKQRPYCPCEFMDSEDPLFYLYTSGSTGKPKGIVHTTGGYLTYATFSTKAVFDLREGDVYACVADIGWITGHSYVVYGPLSNGTTTFMFESKPTYPDCGRYWDMVERHQITQFYTAPTAVRALMKSGEGFVNKYDLSSLRTLGSVGEPINPEAWKWYYKVVGKSKIPIVDTYWQTETGGIVVTPLANIHSMYPGSASYPNFGIQPVILDAKTGKEVEIKDSKKPIQGVLAMKKSWPGIARTIFGDHERYLNTYMKPYPGYYFTGDGAILKDGILTITGRVDDVINVSGHRIGSAEIESALVGFSGVVEAAVIGFPHDIKGEGICAYVICNSEKDEFKLVDLLKGQVKKEIGGFARPDLIVITPSLPKTRSGKIMRRLLRLVASGRDDFGDTSTLADSSTVDTIVKQYQKFSKKKK